MRCSCELLCLGATKEENMAGRPSFLIPLSTLPPLTSAICPYWPVLSVTLQTPHALSPHCQGANKPWKLSIWRASDQTLAWTWKLSYVCVWNSSGAEHHAWWQTYDSVRRTWWWAKRLYTLRFSVTCSSTQMWAMLWLQPAQCWSRPVNLIPISGSLIMCLLVLTFVRKWNKETGKTIGESQKREGGRKRVGLFREVIWQQKA